MLYELFTWLTQFNPDFNVFAYITLRAILGALTALAISLLLGPSFIRRLVKKQVGQPIRKLGPETHFSKAGTPTMGGALILLGVGWNFGFIGATTMLAGAHEPHERGRMQGLRAQMRLRVPRGLALDVNVRGGGVWIASALRSRGCARSGRQCWHRP